MSRSLPSGGRRPLPRSKLPLPWPWPRPRPLNRPILPKRPGDLLSCREGNRNHRDSRIWLRMPAGAIDAQLSRSASLIRDQIWAGWLWMAIDYCISWSIWWCLFYYKKSHQYNAYWIGRKILFGSGVEWVESSRLQSSQSVITLICLLLSDCGA